MRKGMERFTNIFKDRILAGEKTATNSGGSGGSIELRNLSQVHSRQLLHYKFCFYSGLEPKFLRKYFGVTCAAEILTKVT